MKRLLLGLLLSSCVLLYAQNEPLKSGYLRCPQQAKNGIVASNDRFTEIYIIKNNRIKSLVKTRGSGMYNNLNYEKTLVGFKSINDDGMQAPALLNLENESVTLLENYSEQCGQVSFSNDGTIAYTVGNRLIIRKKNSRSEFDLGFYTNLAPISPDGKKVAYNDANGNTYILNLETKQRIQITGSNMFNPIWSPDGSKIVVQSLDENLTVYELKSKRLHRIGQGFNASWMDNSNELAYVFSDRNENFECSGNGIKLTSFDGRSKRVLVPISNEFPQDANIGRNNRILVTRARKNRGLSVLELNRNRVPAKEQAIFKIKEGSEFGLKPQFTKKKGYSPNKVPSSDSQTNNPQKAPAAIGIYDIPYINQVWDVPASYDGCTKWGYWACAPSTACMLLGYYGLLPKDNPVQSRASGVGLVYYSWYVGKDYTTKNGTKIYHRLTANGCGGVSGGYGYMWSGSNRPSNSMPNFYKINGVTTAYFQSSWSQFETETSLNYPYTICLKNNTNGHVVLGFRANGEVKPGSDIISYKRGSFVCHDPYGDYNATYYPNWDGRYATYDWPGYNNGWANINTFYWGCVARYDKPNPSSLTVNPTSLSLSANVNQTATKTFTVKGTNLTSKIAVSSNSSSFTVSPTSLPTAGGTVKVTFNPTAAQSYSGTITVKGGELTKTVEVSGIGNAAPDFTLKELWNFSETKGTLTSKGWDASKVRNIAYGFDQRLYMVYNHSDIKVVNSQTGTELLNLDKTGVSGGTLTFCDVKYCAGKIVACNLASTTDPLKLYAWDNVDAKPICILETTKLGGASQLGDCIGFTGDWTNGSFVFAHDDYNEKVTRIVTYKVTNGIVSETPTVINATNADGTQLKCSSSIRVHPDDNGYWINGKDNPLTRLNTSGVAQYTVPDDVPWGNGFAAFQFKDRGYAMITSFNPGVDSETYKGGCMKLIDTSLGWENGKVLNKYPTAGLASTARNTNCAGGCIVNATSETVEAWVASQLQGVAYFAYNITPSELPIDTAQFDEQSFRCFVSDKILFIKGINTHKVEIFSTMGSKMMEAENSNEINISRLTRGVYIIKATDENNKRNTTKILIK